MSIEVAEPTKELRFVRSGIATLTKSASDSGGSIDITHGLGIVPVVFVYLWDDSFQVGYPIPFIVHDIDTGLVSLNHYVAVDRETLVIHLETPSTSDYYASVLTYSYKYYLFVEKANV